MLIRIQALQPSIRPQAKYQTTLILRKLQDGSFEVETGQVRNLEQE